MRSILRNTILRCLVLATVPVLTLLFYCLDRTPAQQDRQEGRAASAADASKTENYALLVGCTRYRRSIDELWGPANDVPLLAELLREHFGFAQEDITQLVGWPEAPEKRPTHENIVGAFNDLVEKAGPGVRIAILLSGHGTQVPIPESQTNPLDPKNPEPDGMDEVFLPADIESWSGDGLANAIRDNQIGGWLKAMRAEGAHVWILFDCCHSGTMTRGPGEERDRRVLPQTLGIPKRRLQEAASKANAVGAERSRGSGGPPEDAALERLADADQPGTVAAFYAAQSFEKAPELPRPSDAPRTREHYYGLLSYMVSQTLQQRTAPLTYRELGQLILSKYRGERGSRGPTPFFHGDLDQEVLGTRVWPDRARIVLQRDDGDLRLNAGELLGLNPGTILAVHPPPGVPEPDRILGHVRVTSVTPTTAAVESCKYQDHSETAADKLPELGRCEVVWQDVGEMRIRLALRPAEDPLLKEALQALNKEVRPLVNIVADSSEANWSLHRVRPEQAHRQYEIRLTEPKVLLVHAGTFLGGGQQGPAAEQEDSEPVSLAQRVFGRYPADDPQQLATVLARDLPKIFTWQNVWRIASRTGQASDDESQLTLDVRDEHGNEPIPSQLTAGQRIKVRLKNEGFDDLHVTLLFLDGNFGIEIIYTGALEGGEQLSKTGSITGDSVGAEGFIALAVPVEELQGPADYGFLKQTPLGHASRGSRGRMRGPPPESPFGQLMHAATFGTDTRGFATNTSDTPQVVSRSWVTLPGSGDAADR